MNWRREALKRVGVLMNPDNLTNWRIFGAIEGVGKTLNLDLQPLHARTMDQVETVFTAIEGKPIDGIAIVDDAVLNTGISRIANLVTRARLPATGIPELAQAGGLIGYGVNLPHMYRQGAILVDRILKGVKPGDIPIEQPTRFQFIVNLKAAKGLGLTISNDLLLRADDVIR